jgi:leucyl-tRNA synthetase
LPIKFIILTPEENKPFEGDGEHINSDFINGLDNFQAASKVVQTLEELGVGKKTVSFKLRD